MNEGGSDDGGQSKDQFTTRQMNPSADAIGGPQDRNIGQSRRVQQAPGDEGAEGETPEQKAEREKAEEFFRKRMFGDRGRSKKKDEDEEVQDQGSGKEGQDGDQGSVRPKPTKKAVKVTRSPSGLTAADAETIAAAAATAAVKAIQKPVTGIDKEVAANDGPPELEDLEDRDKHAYQIAVRMAKNNPDYGDLPKQMVELGKKKKEYREAWLAENRGQKFSWSDTDHANFLNQVTPEFNTNDFDEARIDLRVEQATKQERERSEDRIREIELRTMEGTLGSKAKQETAKSLEMLVEAVAPEADWDLTSDEGLKTVAEEEPVLWDIVKVHAKYLEDVNRELVKIFDAKDKDGRQMYRIKEQDPIHTWVRDTVARWESVFAKSDSSKTVNENGQTFVTRQQYLSLPPEKRDNHWTILRDQTFFIVAKEIANQAAAAKEKEVARLKALAERNKWPFNPDSIVHRVKSKKAQQSQSSQRQKPQETPRKSREKDEFGSAPSASTGGRVDTQSSTSLKGNEAYVDMMMSKLFPRSRE